PTPTPALTATEEPPLVHLVDGIPVGAVGPLLVYMYPIAQEAFQSLNYPIYRLVIYDVGRSLPVSSFTIGERGRLVSSVLLAHREIYVNYTHEIAVYTLDGSEDRLLYSMPDDLL